MPDPFQTLRAGLGNAGSFQVSGYPFLTGSTVATSGQSQINFPTVTKTILIASRAPGELLVHFAPLENNNVIGGSHYFTLPSSGSLEVSIKCKQIYISAAATSVGGRFEIFAEITNIAPQEMPSLTGSGITI